MKIEAERLQNLGEAAAGIDLGDLRSIHSNPLISAWQGWEGPDDWVWVEIHLESFLSHQVRLNAVDAAHDEVDKDQSDKWLELLQVCVGGVQQCRDHRCAVSMQTEADQCAYWPLVVHCKKPLLTKTGEWYSRSLWEKQFCPSHW